MFLIKNILFLLNYFIVVNCYFTLAGKCPENIKVQEDFRLVNVTFDIKGIVAPVFTPFNQDGSLKLDVIPEYLQYLVINNVHSILVGGTTGEFICLSLKERKIVLAAWMKAAKPAGVKVIVQIGGVPLPDVLDMAKYAEEVGANAIMTLPEIYYKGRTTEDVVKYLETVSNAAPTLPIIYYHFPMMSGVHINVPEFFTLASKSIPNFKAMKADLDVAIQVNDQLQTDQRIFIGNHVLAPAILLGHDSSIATVTNIFPALVHDILNSMKMGDLDSAKLHQEKMNRLVSSVIAQGEFLPAMKVAMHIVTGIEVGPPRNPLRPLDEAHRNTLKTSLQGLSTF